MEDPSVHLTRPALTTWGYGNHSLRDERWRYTQYRDGEQELYDHILPPELGHYGEVIGQTPGHARIHDRHIRTTCRQPGAGQDVVDSLTVVDDGFLRLPVLANQSRCRIAETVDGIRVSQADIDGRKSEECRDDAVIELAEQEVVVRLVILGSSPISS